MKGLILTATLSMALAWPAAANEALTTTTVLRTDALAAGYTVVNPAGTAWVGIPAESIGGTKRLRVKLRPVAHPENYYGEEQPISDLYRYSLHAKGKFKLKQALWLQLSYPSDYSDDEVVLKYYDSARDRWRQAVDQSDDTVAYTHRAQLKKKQSILALFEEPSDDNIVQGIASWYDWTGAACNSFPMGSRIRVTNVATGAFVDSTIVSTGPFIPGRVVDLPREEFSQIAELSAGLVEVTVEAIE